MSAILGWFIAWLLIKALFASWSGGLVKIISSFDIQTLLTPATSLTQFKAVLPLIETHLDTFFIQKLPEKMPMISMFIGEKTVVQLKTIFIEELEFIFPSVLNELLKHSNQDFVNNIATKWKPVLEPMLLKATRKLRIIAFVIGFCWGIITIMLTHLL